MTQDCLHRLARDVKTKKTPRVVPFALRPINAVRIRKFGGSTRADRYAERGRKVPRSPSNSWTRGCSPGGVPAGRTWRTANLRAKILDFGGFDSCRILMLRGGIPRPIGNFPGKFESTNLSRDNLSRQIGCAVAVECGPAAAASRTIDGRGGFSAAPSACPRNGRTALSSMIIISYTSISL